MTPVTTVPHIDSNTVKPIYRFTTDETSDNRPDGGSGDSSYALDETYSLDVAPFMHFDAAILDGADAANNPSDGSAVSAWGDRSGNETSMDSVQSTGTKQPTFNTGGGDPYVSFDGGDFMEIANGPLVDTQTSGLTIITMAQRDSTGHHIVGIGNDNTAGVTLVLRAWGAGVLAYMGGNTDNSFTSASQSAPAVNFTDLNMFTFTKSTGGSITANCKWYYDGGTSSYDNSHLTGTGERPDTLTMKINRIGYGDAAAHYYMRGNLYETMAFNYELSTDDLNTVKDYLAAKWATPLAAGSNTLGAFS